MENLVYIVNGSDKTVNTCISFYNRLKIYEDGTIIYKDKIIEKDEYIYQALLDICGTYTVTNERQKVALNIRKMCQRIIKDRKDWHEISDLIDKTYNLKITDKIDI